MHINSEYFMRKISLIILFVLFFSLISQSVQAALVPCGNPGQRACQLCDLFVLFKNVVDFLLIKIVPAVAVLMIVIGGFMFIMAYFELVPKGESGGPSLLLKAKSLFTYTALGLIIIYSSWLLINLFFQVIGVANWTGLKQGWWKINCP